MKYVFILDHPDISSANSLVRKTENIMDTQVQVFISLEFINKIHTLKVPPWPIKNQ